mgnify:FL=1
MAGYSIPDEAMPLFDLLHTEFPEILEKTGYCKDWIDVVAVVAAEFNIVLDGVYDEDRIALLIAGLLGKLKERNAIWLDRWI